MTAEEALDRIGTDHLPVPVGPLIKLLGYGVKATNNYGHEASVSRAERVIHYRNGQSPVLTR